MNLVVIIFWFIILFLILSIVYINKALIEVIKNMSELIKADNLIELKESKKEEKEQNDEDNYQDIWNMSDEEIKQLWVKVNII